MPDSRRPTRWSGREHSRSVCGISSDGYGLRRATEVFDVARKEELVRRFTTFIGAGATLGLIALSVLRLQSQGKTIDWRYFGADKAFTRYSPADQITRDNVRNLRIVWRRPATNPSFKEAFPQLR